MEMDQAAGRPLDLIVQRFATQVSIVIDRAQARDEALRLLDDAPRMVTTRIVDDGHVKRFTCGFSVTPERRSKKLGTVPIQDDRANRHDVHS